MPSPSASHKNTGIRPSHRRKSSGKRSGKKGRPKAPLSPTSVSYKKQQHQQQRNSEVKERIETGDITSSLEEEREAGDVVGGRRRRRRGDEDLLDSSSDDDLDHRRRGDNRRLHSDDGDPDDHDDDDNNNHDDEGEEEGEDDDDEDDDRRRRASRMRRNLHSHAYSDDLYLDGSARSSSSSCSSSGIHSTRTHGDGDYELQEIAGYLFRLREGETILKDYHCAIQGKILLHGRMYIRYVFWVLLLLFLRRGWGGKEAGLAVTRFFFMKWACLLFRLISFSFLGLSFFSPSPSLCLISSLSFSLLSLSHPTHTSL